MFDECRNIKSIKFEGNTNEIDIGSNNNSINNSQENFTLDNNSNSLLSYSEDKEIFYNDETELYKGIVSSISSIANAGNSNNVSSENKKKIQK